MDITLNDRGNEIIKQCLSNDYDDYVAYSKAKYFYETIYNSPNLELIWECMSLMPSEANKNDFFYVHINNIKSKNIFFPVYELEKGDNHEYSSKSLIFYGFCCEIRTIMKRLLPPDMKKKIKSIGYGDIDFIDLDEFVHTTTVQSGKMDDDTNPPADVPPCIKNYIELAKKNIVQLKHLNKIFRFKVDDNLVRLNGFRNGYIEIEPIEKDYETIY